MDSRVHCLEDKDSRHQQVAERVEQMVRLVQCVENKEKTNQQMAERVQCLEDLNETHKQMAERLRYLEGKDRTNQQIAARLQCLQDQNETHQQNEQNIMNRLGALEQKLVFAVNPNSLLARDTTRDRSETAVAATPWNPVNGSIRARHPLDNALRETSLAQGNEETTRNPCDTCSSNMANRTKTPDAGAPNRTVQDQMNRLEATVLGSTLLCGAWILWNQWTR